MGKMVYFSNKRNVSMPKFGWKKIINKLINVFVTNEDKLLPHPSFQILHIEMYVLLLL